MQKALLSSKKRDVMGKQKPGDVPKMLISLNFKVLHKNLMDILKNIKIKFPVFVTSRKIKHNIPYILNF